MSMLRYGQSGTAKKDNILKNLQIRLVLNPPPYRLHLADYTYYRFFLANLHHNFAKKSEYPPTHLENFQNIIFGGSRLPLNELGFLNCGIFDIQVNNKKSKQDECCCHSGWPTSLHSPILMHRPLLLLHAPLPLFLLPPNCPSTTPPPSFHQCQSASPPPQYPPCSSVLCPAVHTSSSTLFCIESNLRDKLINLTRDLFIQRQGQKCTWSSDFPQSADTLMNVEKE